MDLKKEPKNASFSFWILVFLMGDVNPIVVFSSILLIGCVYFYGFKSIPSTAIRLDFEKTVTHENLLITVYRPEVTAVTDTLTYTTKNVTAQASNLDTIVSEMANILNGRIEAVDKLNHAMKQTSPKVKAGQCCKYKPGDGSYDKNFFTSIDKSNVCFRDGSNECFGFGSKDCSSSYGNEEFLLKAQENLQNLGDNGLAWQYFGDDANGIFSNYPSAFASNCDMYDPRLRP